MFEKLFSNPAVLRRQQEGPLAAERAVYLQDLASCGMADKTLVGRALGCLRIAGELSRWPPGHVFALTEIESLADCRGPFDGRPDDEPGGADGSGPAPEPAVGARTDAGRSRTVALEFLRSLGRLRPDPPPEPGPHDAKLEDFLAAQRELQWRSERTCESGRAMIQGFLDHLHHRGVALRAIAAADIDNFFEALAARWGRRSRAKAAWALRKWLDFGGRRGWFRPGLDAAVLSPRLYQQEGLPLGPTWETVGRMLANTEGDSPAAVRDRAILLLLSVYGVRSGTVCRLRLDDIDWTADRIVFERSKSGRLERVPLHPLVGEAIAHYLSTSRPRTSSRAVFLTLRTPQRPLTRVALYGIVAHSYPATEAPPRGRGPHGLRHACARHLIDSGHSFKEVSDHLGHRSLTSTSVYAKVALRSLRQVALDDLGDLA